MIGLCREYHCLPSQIEAEDISAVQMLTLARMGDPEYVVPDDDEWPGEDGDVDG